MFHQQSKYAQASQNIFMNSMMGLANVLAIIITLFGAPPLYTRTIGWVQGVVATHYGYGFGDLVSLGWAVLCGCLVFFISRASIGTALVMGAVVLATRFL